MACKCYHADKNFLGSIGVCWGTKECEACSCGGDEAKCDFYDYVRERVKKPTTNADRIRAMTDEELSHFFASFYEKLFRCPEEDWEKADCLKRPCDSCWLEWLRKEVEP